MQEFCEEFSGIFYTPVSYVLFLIGLTFPENPDANTITVANLWVKLLFEVLPLKNINFMKHLEDIKFDSEHKPLTTRKQFVDFVFAMHEKILHETLNPKQTFIYFEQLRANDCNSTEPASKEASCIRTTQQIPFTCVVMTSMQNTESFWMDKVFHKQEEEDKEEEEEDLWTRAMQSTSAFCSCVFSAKWFVLHMIASGFPKNPNATQKYKYHTFLVLFGKLLACFACRVNFEANLQLVHYNPQLDLVSNVTMVDFMYRLHNTVNEMLGKRNDIVTLEETIAFFHLLAITQNTDLKCSVMIVQEKDAFARFYFSNKKK